ncbi:MAG: hypothetical protein ACXWT1_22350 [Methylobacter sp.]
MELKETNGQTFEDIETPVPADKFSIDVLLRTSLPALFIKAKINHDEFKKGFYKTLWIKMLEKEEADLSSYPFSEGREARLLRIAAKLKEFQNFGSWDLAAESRQGPGAQAVDTERELTKLDKQQAAIMKVIQLKDFDPLAIPDGEKGTLRKICEADYSELFDGSSSFDNAWKVSRLLFRMANHASYSKKGKS